MNEIIKNYSPIPGVTTKPIKHPEPEPWVIALRKVKDSIETMLTKGIWPRCIDEEIVDIEIDMCGELVEVTCSYYYHPAEDCKRYGDPLDCYEGSPEEFYIYWINFGGLDLLPLLTDKQVLYIEKLIREYENI